VSRAAEVCTLTSVCQGAKLVTEGAQEFIFLPGLSVTVGDAVKTLDALLSPSAHSGYTTRLFLAASIPERPNIGAKPANWTTHAIMGCTWHTWSWNHVSADLPLLQMLLAHLAALR
jgi:hypothetical protein